MGIANLIKDPEDPNSGLTKSEEEKAQVLSGLFLLFVSLNSTSIQDWISLARETFDE